MVAMLAFGGTFAYFTATTKEAKADKITTGKIVLKSAGEATFVSTVMPKENLLASGSISYNPTGTTAASWVFVKITITKPAAGECTVVAGINTADSAEGKAKWTKLDAVSDDANGVAVYYIEVAANATADLLFCDSIIFDATANIHEGATEDGTANGGTTSNVAIEGAEISVSVKAESIQKNGLTEVATAYAQTALSK